MKNSLVLIMFIIGILSGCINNTQPQSITYEKTINVTDKSTKNVISPAIIVGKVMKPMTSRTDYYIIDYNNTYETHYDIYNSIEVGKQYNVSITDGIINNLIK